uniref:Uncharacterized protein n=1 Tax=Arundo donax TaxID=35708 RepID=A0A0A9G0G2_ARUDO
MGGGDPAPDHSTDTRPRRR